MIAASPCETPCRLCSAATFMALDTAIELLLLSNNLPLYTSECSCSFIFQQGKKHACPQETEYHTRSPPRGNHRTIVVKDTNARSGTLTLVRTAGVTFHLQAQTGDFTGGTFWTRDS